MKIRVFSFFYNEAALLPYFLRHYAWADALHIVVSKSTDGTRELLEQASVNEPESGGHSPQSGVQNPQPTVRKPVIEIEDWDNPGGKIDDFQKMAKWNEVVGRQWDADWLVVVDADEFIWPMDNPFANQENVQAFLATVPAPETAIQAAMWNVFRHVTDSDLDPTRAPALQRRHGLADLNHPQNAPYRKPIVIRANRGLAFTLGNHYLLPNPELRFASGHHFEGAHWQNADPIFAVTRRCRDRRDRLGEANLKAGLGEQHRHITEESVLALCKAHENDEACF